MLLDAETKQSPQTIPLTGAELKDPCKTHWYLEWIESTKYLGTPPTASYFWLEFQMPAFTLQALKSPNCIPPKLSELVSAINHLTMGNKKISAFRILISGNMLKFQSVISLLSSLCICTFHYTDFPCYVILITAFKWFHVESSRLLHRFDTYRCVFPNPDTTFILPKIKLGKAIL